MSQETLSIIQTIFEIAIVPLLGVLVPYIIKLIRTKSQEIQDKTNNELVNKYIDLITDTVVNCVIATNQTYVESIKNSGSFDAEAQKEAFNKTLASVKTILGEDMLAFISEMFGDVETYLTVLIETAVNENK